MKKVIGFLLLILFVFTGSAFSQEEEKEEKEKEGYKFTVKQEVPVTPVRNQYRSGTCWSFSGIGLLESELLRMGRDTFDLSEMFVVRNVYEEKAKKYIRFHGKINFAAGGGFSDVIMVLDDYGMVPEEVYCGKVIGEEKHIHGEMDNVLKAYVDAVQDNKNRKLTPVWFKGFRGVLDAYLGEYPCEFEYNGKEYTPQSFAEMLGLNPDDYVELTSYTHHPFYEPFVLEIPDNWMYSPVYNLPLEEMMEVIDHALNEGYAVAWGADVSDKGFSWKNGVAIVPEKNLEDLTGTERERWEELSQKEKEKMLYSFEEPGDEKEITQEMRQQAFNNYETTDDHGMLFTGIAEDQNGTKYYVVKNSWGTTSNDYEGYMYASGAFTAYKTMSIMLHKDAIPKEIKKKLGGME